MAAGMVFRNTIRTLIESGQDVMGPGMIIWRDTNVDIRVKSKLVVEHNQSAVIKIQGQIVQTFDPGYYDLSLPNSPVLNFFAKLGYAGNVPWIIDAIFFSMSRFDAKCSGISVSSELIPVTYQVAFSFNISEPVKLLQNVQLNGSFYTINDMVSYISPVIDQIFSKNINGTSIKDLSLNFQKLSNNLYSSLKESLASLGINLISTLIIRLEPEDETIKKIVQYMNMGMDMINAVKARISENLASKSDSALLALFLESYFSSTQTTQLVPDTKQQKKVH